MFARLDIGRIRQRSWWIVLLLAVATIALVTFVRSWADCQYFYQSELAHYLAHPDAYVRPPQRAVMPRITVLIRIAGRLLDMVAAWIGWTGGLYLVGLFDRREARFSAILRIVAWSWLPFVVRGLVQSVYMGLAQDPIFNAGLSGFVFDNTPPPPGGGYPYVMPTTSQRLWSALLAHLDVYLFWHLALVVVGLQRIAGLGRRKAWVNTTVVFFFLVAMVLLPTCFGNSLQRFRLF
jgi:hypothetical protein